MDVDWLSTTVDVNSRVEPGDVFGDVVGRTLVSGSRVPRKSDFS